MKTIEIEQTQNENSISPTQESAIQVKSLAEKAILLQLVIGKFTGHKKDKKASEEVSVDKNAEKQNVSVVKRLFQGEDLKKIQNIEQKMRTFFYKRVAPWNREGFGIVRINNYIKIKLELEEMSRQYKAASSNLIDNYDELLKHDRASLGELFNEKDYPSKEDMKSKFYVEINVHPVEKTDFRSGVLSNEEVNTINAQVEERIYEALKKANLDVVNRVKESLTALMDRLVNLDGKFHVSSVYNVSEQLQAAIDLNVAGDDKIDSIFNEIKVKIDSINAESLKKSPSARVEAASIAENAISSVEDLMKSFM
jgi:hypothetical protein